MNDRGDGNESLRRARTFSLTTHDTDDEEVTHYRPVLPRSFSCHISLLSHPGGARSEALRDRDEMWTVGKSSARVVRRFAPHPFTPVAPLRVSPCRLSVPPFRSTSCHSRRVEVERNDPTHRLPLPNPPHVTGLPSFATHAGNRPTSVTTVPSAPRLRLVPSVTPLRRL